MMADFWQLDFKRKESLGYPSVWSWRGCGGGGRGVILYTRVPLRKGKVVGCAFARSDHSKPGVSLWAWDQQY